MDSRSKTIMAAIVFILASTAFLMDVPQESDAYDAPCTFYMKDSDGSLSSSDSYYWMNGGMGYNEIECFPGNWAFDHVFRGWTTDPDGTEVQIRNYVPYSEYLPSKPSFYPVFSDDVVLLKGTASVDETLILNSGEAFLYEVTLSGHPRIVTSDVDFVQLFSNYDTEDRKTHYYVTGLPTEAGTYIWQLQYTNGSTMNWTMMVEEPSATVSFSSNGQIIDTQVVDRGSTAISFNPVLDGYTFRGWYADPAFIQSFDFSAPVTADTTVYAKWDGNFAFTSDPTADGVVTIMQSLNNTVLFDASSSSGSYIVWDYGDGSTATGIYQTHYYAEPGTYSVKLFVYNDNGNIDMKEYTVSIPDEAVGGGEFDVHSLSIVLLCILGGGLVIRRII